jgi:hypothetical protein
LLAAADTATSDELTFNFIGTMIIGIAMTVSIDEITAAALALPAEARAELADRVAASIASGIPPHIKQLQMEEVQKRRSEVLSGKVQGIPSQQVRDEIAFLLK